MARIVVDNNELDFFSYDKRVFRTLGWGCLFGVLLAILPLTLSFITCRLAPNNCLGDTISNYRIALVIDAVVILGLMILVRQERPIYIILPVLLVFWNLALALPIWPGRLLAYGLVGSLVFVLFGWLTRVNNWLVSTVLTIVVTILLFLMTK